MNKNQLVKISAEKSAMILPDIGVFTFNTGIPLMSYDRSNNPFHFYEGYNFECMPQTVGQYKVIPFGVNNNLPDFIRQIMEGNNLAPGIINREIGLLTGDGVQLYETVFENGEIRREYEYDSDIWDWLNSWNFRRYIDMACVEYKYMNGLFSRQYRTKGARLNKGKISKLEIVPNTNARLEWVETNRIEDVKGIITADFNHYVGKNIMYFPVFDFNDPMKGGITMSYHNTYTFAHNFYSLPSYYGTLKWIMMNSDVPEILKYMNENSITAAYHIHIPQAYWEEKQLLLQEKYPEKSDLEIKKLLDNLQDEICEQIKSVLSGKKNAGKFITTVDFTDPIDTKIHQSWKIEPIDQKIKDFVEMQVKIAEQSNSATTSGMSLHPALSNIVVNGKLASGSEMLYAFKLYLATDTTIPEAVIFENINQCLKVNFPKTNLKLGFYHSIVKTEDSISSSQRVKNNI
ncbi:MAG: hypothetical protein LBB53_04395 [Prevotellaceae bacterium]|jgi:hypothetical protein|nr:hypothetical protein [Prevotellaceae bacterium]